MKNISLILFSLLLSGLLILSFPLLNYFMNGKDKEEKKMEVIPVNITHKIKPQKTERVNRKIKSPNYQKVMRSQIVGGPRFAMNLDVAGQSEGVQVSLDLTKKSSVIGQREGQSEGVDMAPTVKGSLALRLPAEVKKREQDVSVRLSFCVNPGGKAYEIKVVEENPPGLGMGEAGRNALQAALFSPAMKAGQPVAFCGMEQPFEIKFDE